MTDDNGSRWVAEDPLLRRAVWIHQHPRPDGRCTERRRAVERPTRLRWIGTGESEEGAWDAYDEPNAGPSLWARSARERCRPWREARRVLRDLACEIVAAREDDTLPSRLSLAQIVVSLDGTVVLLDVPFESNAIDAETFATDAEGLRAFFQLLVCALATGDFHNASELRRRVQVARLPVSDHELLADLWDPSLDPLDVIASMPQRMADEHRRIANMSVRSRITHVLAIALLGGLMWLGAPPVARNGMKHAAQSFLEGWHAADGVSAPQVSVPDVPPLLAGLIGFLLPVASALLFGGGLALRLEGVEVCAGNGRPAQGWQLLLRILPLALGTGAAFQALFAGRVAFSAMILVSLLIVAVVGTLLNPTRTIGDMVAGTYLRPK